MGESVKNEDGDVVVVRLQKTLGAEARRWDLVYDSGGPMEGFQQGVIKIRFISSKDVSGFSGENGLRVAAGRPAGKLWQLPR